MSKRNNQKKQMQDKENGVSLLRKSKYGILRVIFSRAGIMLLLIVLQIAAMVYMYFIFDEYVKVSAFVSFIFKIVMLLYLLNSRSNSTFKITWLAVIIMLPVFGTLLYFYTEKEIGHRALKKRLEKIDQSSKGLIEQNTEARNSFKSESNGAYSLADYLYTHGGFPVYTGTDIKYFSSGEAKFEALTLALEEAEKFIFLEYFSIEEGYMWGNILEILIRKAEQGVDVRVLCDGTCELTTLSPSYAARLRAKGIKCKMFNHVTPFLSTHYNYRDHRKIAVIDGKTAFNGGVNLSDEYINKKKKFGHWKDAAVEIRGSAVKSFTYMFLQMWEIDEINIDFGDLYKLGEDEATVGSGYIIPYADRPLDKYNVGERVYMDILNRAKEYVYIMTPYLILDGEMETAIKFASERGVDVNIMLPGIPDKKYAYALAKTHYASLLDAGVKIYEYSPGFLHSKVVISDGTEAVVGSINFDYRSFYHHFECATYMYGAACISDIKRDYTETLKKCRSVSYDTLKKERISVKLRGKLLKVIAPIM